MPIVQNIDSALDKNVGPHGVSDAALSAALARAAGALDRLRQHYTESTLPLLRLPEKTDDLAEMRYRATIRPGFQEEFEKLFPPPRQRWLDAQNMPEENLRALPHPTLIVHGREDRVVPLAASLKLFELIPNSQLHVFGRCGHWTMIEQRDRFNKLVLDFFGE